MKETTKPSDTLPLEPLVVPIGTYFKQGPDGRTVAYTPQPDGISPEMVWTRLVRLERKVTALVWIGVGVLTMVAWLVGWVMRHQ